MQIIISLVFFQIFFKSKFTACDLQLNQLEFKIVKQVSIPIESTNPLRSLILFNYSIYIGITNQKGKSVRSNTFLIFSKRSQRLRQQLE